MEGEIDLRPYIKLLLHRLPWIVGAAVLAAGIGFGVTSLISPVYEATTLVAITEPYQIVEFDPRFRSAGETQPLRAFPELATSDELLENLLVQIEPSYNIHSVQQLHKLLEARPGSDPSLIRFSVRHQNPRIAADIANTWAEMFVIWANQVYGNQGEVQVRFFEGQLQQAESELQTAEAVLAEFQALNRTEIISNTLSFYNQSRIDYLAAQRMVSSLSQDVQALRNQMVEQPPNADVSLAEQLASLSLQLQVLNIQFQGETVAPLQLQINSLESLRGASRNEQITFLDNLLQLLTAKSAQIGMKLDQLEPDILELQRQKQEMEGENARLVLNRTVAEETYLTLARKVDEERIVAQDSSRGVRLASRASVPVVAVNQSRMLNAAVAGALGLVVAVGVVFLVDWWQHDQSAQRKERPETSVGSEPPVAATQERQAPV